MKKVVSGALVPKGKLCSTMPSLQLASQSAALPKTGRKPQLVPCGVGGWLGLTYRRKSHIQNSMFINVATK